MSHALLLESLVLDSMADTSSRYAYHADEQLLDGRLPS